MLIEFLACLDVFAAAFEANHQQAIELDEWIDGILEEDESETDDGMLEGMGSEGAEDGEEEEWV